MTTFRHSILIIAALQLIPALCLASDQPDPGQDLDAQDVIDFFDSQDASSNEQPSAPVTETPFTPIDESLFESGAGTRPPSNNTPGVSAEQLRSEAASAGALRERVVNPTNMMQGATNDRYRLRQQIQGLRQYVREQQDKSNGTDPAQQPFEPWQQEVPDRFENYPPGAFSQAP